MQSLWFCTNVCNWSEEAHHYPAADWSETILSQFARNLCRILSDCRSHRKLSHLWLIYVKLELAACTLHGCTGLNANWKLFQHKLDGGVLCCLAQMCGVLLHKHCHIVANSWITWEAAEVRAASNFGRCRGGGWFGPEGAEGIRWGREVFIYYFLGL